jgi:hypothetical protein
MQLQQFYRIHSSIIWCACMLCCECRQQLVMTVCACDARVISGKAGMTHAAAVVTACEAALHISSVNS